jgi:hypothetical protein
MLAARAPADLPDPRQDKRYRLLLSVMVNARSLLRLDLEQTAPEGLDLLTDEERVWLKELQAEEDAEREAAEAEIEAASPDSAEGREGKADKGGGKDK